MKHLRTYKLKITSNHPRFDQVAADYKEAATWLSEIIFKRGKCTRANHLQREFYSTIREKFNLPSQVTCSIFKHVVGNYRSMKSNGQWQQATYKKLIVPLVYERDFALRRQGVRVWGETIHFKSRPLPKGEWADSKLKKIKGQWYLCLTINVNGPQEQVLGGIVGVDRGQKNILTAVDINSGKTLYERGTELNHRRQSLRRTRAKVASVGTRSAKRLLKRLSGRERAVTQNILHIASKRLVAFAISVGASTIAFEDLCGFNKQQTKDNKQVHHKQRARNNRWPYAMLEFFTAYKASAVGLGLDYVPPKNTSRGCPKCGHASKSNRKGLSFRCVVCDYADNADRVGGTNVSLRSLLQRQAAGERAMCQLAYSSNSC